MKADKLTLERIKLMHPAIRYDVEQMYLDQCESLTGRSLLRYSYTIRTYGEQDGLYALGRTIINPVGKSVKKPLGNIVTWAKGGQSYHNFGLAFDIVLLIDKDGNGSYETASWDQATDFDGDKVADYREVVDIAMQYGFEWGGNWAAPKQDSPHFQKTLGYSVRILDEMVRSGKVIVNTNYPKIGI